MHHAWRAICKNFFGCEILIYNFIIEYLQAYQVFGYEASEDGEKESKLNKEEGCTPQNLQGYTEGFRFKEKV